MSAAGPSQGANRTPSGGSAAAESNNEAASVGAHKDALVVFTPSGRRGRVPVGTPLLQAARSLGVDIDSVCGGRGMCGRCQILVADQTCAMGKCVGNTPPPAMTLAQEGESCSFSGQCAVGLICDSFAF